MKKNVMKSLFISFYIPAVLIIFLIKMCKNVQKEMYKNLRSNFICIKAIEKLKLNVIVLDLIKQSFDTN
jgi:hypothetical protein